MMTTAEDRSAAFCLFCAGVAGWIRPDAARMGSLRDQSISVRCGYAERRKVVMRNDSA
jgi:hypothetical protein